MTRLALFEPDIPQNTGAIMRLCVCLGVALDIIEPCGFLMTDKNMKRAGMDYIEQLDMTRHRDWDAFVTAQPGRRVLLTTKGTTSFLDFSFQASDVLILGRESVGVPDPVFESCDAHVCVPMATGARSLNVAMAGAIVLSEALRQGGQYPSF